MANDLWVFSSSLSAYMRAASGGSSVGSWCLEMSVFSGVSVSLNVVSLTSICLTYVIFYSSKQVATLIVNAYFFIPMMI